MDKKHIKNLKALATKLEAPGLEGFDMMAGGLSPHEVSSGLYARTQDPLAVAAADGIGHPARHIGGEGWESYAEETFAVGRWSKPYQWVFDERWAYRDNSPTGAARRIRWLLRHGVPKDWEDQIIGYAPLCYR